MDRSVNNIDKSTKKNKLNKLILIVLIAIIVILIVFIGIMFISKNNDNKYKSSENKTSIVEQKNVKSGHIYSVKTLDVFDDELGDDKKELAKFVDENFFFIESYEEMVRYADTLKGIKVAFYCQVKTILSTDNNNYEAVCNWGNSDDYFWGVDDNELRDSVIIRGEKPEKMFIVGDTLTIKGKLVGAETKNIEGKSKYLPVIEIADLGIGGEWYSESTIRKVAKLIFGNNIKVRRPTDDENEKMVNYEMYSYHDSLWLIEFENQSNLNFKVFDIWASYSSGLITYNALYNQGIEKDYLNKYLYITPDLQKYIVFDMDRSGKYMYISVYDRNLNKIWSREISNVSRMVWDATDTQLTFVSDNDMYNIDLESGENIGEPLYVGKKNAVRIVENGYILLSDSTDDAVMFVNNDGKITNKYDINMKISPRGYLSTTLQKLDNNYVILYSYAEVNEYIEVTSKYIIIDKDGNLITETK